MHNSPATSQGEDQCISPEKVCKHIQILHIIPKGFCIEEYWNLWARLSHSSFWINRSLASFDIFLRHFLLDCLSKRQHILLFPRLWFASQLFYGPPGRLPTERGHGYAREIQFLVMHSLCRREKANYLSHIPGRRLKWVCLATALLNFSVQY